MLKNKKTKDIAVLLLTITLCFILILTVIGSAIMNNDTGGKMEELIAFILGSITTIVGEYILLQLKLGLKDEEKEEKSKEIEK